MPIIDYWPLDCNNTVIVECCVPTIEQYLRLTVM